MKRSIVWFKTDLRLHDNETLVQAIKNSNEVIPVYCIDEAHFQNSTFGFRKTGNFRAQFLLQSLEDLDKNLRQLGSGLILVKGIPEIEIPKLVQQYQVSRVYAKKEVAYEEIQTLKRVEESLWKHKCELLTFSTSTLYYALDLPFTIKDIPEVFTNFRKQLEKESKIREVIPCPVVIKSPTIAPMELPSLKDLGFTEPIFDQRTAFPFSGGETAALLRLRNYFFESKLVLKYKETRNQMFGVDYSSKLSSWLALGCISARKVYAELKSFEKEYEANESTYWLYFELIWRDYFRFMMKKHQHRYFQKNGIKVLETNKNKFDKIKFEQWKLGQTGQDFIDANMRELLNTGYMSNRGRQNVASYFCHHLKLDWRYGAAYFEEQLIDYDVCSNWGNWAYVAGVGNDPRPDRVFNIEKQASEYDKHFKFRNLWLN